MRRFSSRCREAVAGAAPRPTGVLLFAAVAGVAAASVGPPVLARGDAPPVRVETSVGTIPAPDPFLRAARSVWSRWVLARKRLAWNEYTVLSRRWPELGSAIRRRRDLDLARLEMRDIEVGWLFDHAPEIVRAAPTLEALARETIDAETADSLRAANTLYAQLAALVETLRHEASADPATDRLAAHAADIQADPAIAHTREGFRKQAQRLAAEYAASRARGARRPQD